MTGRCDSEQSPPPLIISLRRWVRRTLLRPRRSLYEKLYEAHARKHPDARAIGAGDDDFETLGRIEFEILRAEGLERNTALLDFGCGTGRLAVQTIPYLTEGAYIGVDISPSMLKRAAETVARACPAPSCRVAWVRQPWARFLQDDASVDMICAFSVFTHMEHEDTYLYLKEARRVVRPGGRLVLSCLPMNSALARRVFLGTAAIAVNLRWRGVRNVVTSMDLMSEVARLAGWTPVRWHSGEHPIEALRDRPGQWALGQAVCVLEA